MKKQLFICLSAVFLFGICNIINAETKPEKTSSKPKKAAKKWQKNKNRHPDDGVDLMIREKYSKEIAGMRKLRKDDPEAFNAKNKELYEKIRSEVKAEREKFRKMVMEYRKTKDPKTREAISEYVSKAYDRRINAETKKNAALKERLEKAEKRLAEIKAQKEEKINKKLKVILEDPKLGW
jgi:hypothetical protein